MTPAQTATETESSNKENTGMEIVLAEDEAPRGGVSLGPRGQDGEGTWTPVVATKQDFDFFELNFGKPSH